MKVTHTLKPIYDCNSKILILGSMPSIKSRELEFYYANPRNRFWPTLEKVFNVKIGTTNKHRIDFLLKHNIALFDCLKSCDISYSKDSSIKNPVPNDIKTIIENSKIEIVFTTGKKAYELYNKLIYPKVKIKAIYLPSTSPANSCKCIEEKLLKDYRKILDYLN